MHTGMEVRQETAIRKTDIEKDMGRQYDGMFGEAACEVFNLFSHM
jgi:hypothetical protein